MQKTNIIALIVITLILASVLPSNAATSRLIASFPTLGGDSIAVDSNGYIYVLDSNFVQKYDNSGNYITRWGNTGDEQLYGASGIAIDKQNNIYIADSYNFCVKKYSQAGSLLLKFGSYGVGNGQFKGLRDVVVDNNGNIYTTDLTGYRVQKFDSNGNFILKWGSSGTLNGQFTGLNGIAVDKSNNIYTTDSSVSNIQKFSSNGVFLEKWDDLGLFAVRFRNPMGISVDSNGYVYCANTTWDNVVMLTSKGDLFLKVADDWELNIPTDVAVDKRGIVYAIDYTGNVFKYAIDGVSSSPSLIPSMLNILLTQ